MNQPIISVIIPVYNPGKHLVKCLDSIINQTYHHLQIVLVDDGSTDGSNAVCDEYALKDKRILCIHQKNAGVSKARNAGIALATGDYYSFPDSDDYLELDTYEYLIKMINQKDCDVISFEYFITYPSREIEHQMGADYYGLFGRADAHRLVLTGTPFACNKLFSKKLITGSENLPGISFREDIYRGEDSLFVHEVFERADRVWFDSRPLYHYVQSEESAVRGRFRRSQLSALKLYDAYRPIYQEVYPDLWPVFLKGMAHLLIGLYYDMWADEDNFEDEQKAVLNEYKTHERIVSKENELGLKEKSKFKLFSVSPNLFCRIHKALHHL